MNEIIPSSVSDSKPILTAQEMFQLWNWKRSDEVEVCEFAEAYAETQVERFRLATIEPQKKLIMKFYHDLLRRAAGLLRFEPREHDADWDLLRAEWLRDAGMEK